MAIFFVMRKDSHFSDYWFSFEQTIMISVCSYLQTNTKYKFVCKITKLDSWFLKKMNIWWFKQMFSCLSSEGKILPNIKKIKRDFEHFSPIFHNSIFQKYFIAFALSMNLFLSTFIEKYKYEITNIDVATCKWLTLKSVTFRICQNVLHV